jgi:hypothetical protein
VSQILLSIEAQLLKKPFSLYLWVYPQNSVCKYGDVLPGNLHRLRNKLMMDIKAAVQNQKQLL